MGCQRMSGVLFVENKRSCFSLTSLKRQLIELTALFRFLKFLAFVHSATTYSDIDPFCFSLKVNNVSKSIPGFFYFPYQVNIVIMIRTFNKMPYVLRQFIFIVSANGVKPVAFII